MKKSKLILGSSLLALSFGALVVSSMKSNTLRSLPVGEVRAADGSANSFVGQRLRMVGFVSHSPVRRTTAPSSAGTVDVAHFMVEDKGRSVQVTFRDALPDTFRLGGPVQVDGIYAAPGLIEADHVLTKCPSKYDQLKAAPAPRPQTASPAKSAAIEPAHQFVS
jgi:cytochrome c-type biogenesis protein CcmE